MEYECIGGGYYPKNSSLPLRSRVPLATPSAFFTFHSSFIYIFETIVSKIFTILHQAVAELQTPDNKIDKKLHQVGAEMSEEKLSPVVREIAPQAEQIFRDQYVLEFIGGKDYEHENTMKKALINRMKDFVLEFGKDFLFIDEEYQPTSERYLCRRRTGRKCNSQEILVSSSRGPSSRLWSRIL